MGGNALKAPDAGTTQGNPEQSTEQPNPSLGFPFDRWSPTLLEITKAIEYWQLAQRPLERLTRLGQGCIFQ